MADIDTTPDPTDTAPQTTTGSVDVVTPAAAPVAEPAALATTAAPPAPSPAPSMTAASDSVVDRRLQNIADLVRALEKSPSILALLSGILGADKA